MCLQSSFPPVSRTHSLLRLWERVQPMAEAVWANETHVWELPRMRATDVSELIGQLHAIDPRGNGVRYARDNNGSLTMLNVSRVDLEHAERNIAPTGRPAASEAVRRA